MPLPTLSLPAGFCWLVDGYSSAPDPLYGQAPMTTGHSRQRRRWTVADRREKASLLLTDEQMATWHEFHEETLQAGLLPFSARFANYGPGLRWFDCLVLEYATEPRPPLLTRLTATLLLRGEPQETGPEENV